MQRDQTKAAIDKPSEEQDGKAFRTKAQSDKESIEPQGASPPDLRRAAEDLKTQIAEAKRRNDVPVDPALVNPAWERSAADGRFDIPDEDDD